ncbi:unnamed protein product, partial [Adineta ricciae]
MVIAVTILSIIVIHDHKTLSTMTEITSTTEASSCNLNNTTLRIFNQTSTSISSIIENQTNHSRCEQMTFAPSEVHQMLDATLAMAVGDFDDDNLTDVILANLNSKSIQIYSKYLNGRFQDRVRYNNFFFTDYFEIADVNNDK